MEKLVCIKILLSSRTNNITNLVVTLLMLHLVDSPKMILIFTQLVVKTNVSCNGKLELICQDKNPKNRMNNLMNTMTKMMMKI